MTCFAMVAVKEVKVLVTVAVVEVEALATVAMLYGLELHILFSSSSP